MDLRWILFLLILMLLSNCVEKGAKAGSFGKERLEKEEIILRAEKLLRGDEEAREFVLDTLYMVVSDNENEYKVTFIRKGIALDMIPMIGNGFQIDDIVVYKEAGEGKKERLKLIFDKYVDDTDRICFLKREEREGYFVFSKKGNEWCLKAYYFAGGKFYRF